MFKRLRFVGFNIRQLTSLQPSALGRLQYNRHLIGKDPRYMFCTGATLSKFVGILGLYKISCSKCQQQHLNKNKTMALDVPVNRYK